MAKVKKLIIDREKFFKAFGELRPNSRFGQNLLFTRTIESIKRSKEPQKIKHVYNLVDDISITVFTQPEDPPGIQTLRIKTNDGKYYEEYSCPDMFYVIQAILIFLEKEI